MSQPNRKSLADVVDLIRIEGARIGPIGAKPMARLIDKMSSGGVAGTHEHSIDIGTLSNFEVFRSAAIIEVISFSVLIPL